MALFDDDWRQGRRAEGGVKDDWDNYWDRKQWKGAKHLCGLLLLLSFWRGAGWRPAEHHESSPGHVGFEVPLEISKWGWHIIYSSEEKSGLEKETQQCPSTLNLLSWDKGESPDILYSRVVIAKARQLWVLVIKKPYSIQLQSNIVNLLCV